MARKKYSCDFETTTNPNDCRVWAWGWMEVGNTNNYKIGIHMSDFMSWAVKCQGDLYFHNLKFDGSFIVNWLLKNGFSYSKSGQPNTFNVVISAMGQWYKIDICLGYKGRRKIHTNIFDSLKMLPFKVKEIAKSFKLDVLKGEIDYHKERPVGYEPTDEEINYIKNDIEIIAKALKIQFNQGMNRMTAGSNSLAGYKAVISNKVFEKTFPSLSLELDKELRKAYRGGFTWLNEKYKEKEVGEGLVFDVNSLYPAQMYMRELPYGLPVPYKGEYEYDEDYPLYIQKIRCEFYLKEGKIPIIQIKNNPYFKSNEYLKHSKGEIVELYVTNIDLKLIKEHYNLYGLSYEGGWKFRSKTGMFNQFIDKWMYVKNTETGAKKLLAKLMLNSLYGKFATNPDVTGKVPYLKDDGSLGFKVGEEEYKNPVYLPMGIFITSWARYTCITAAQKCYGRIIYCDTDSIHVVGTEIPESINGIVDDKKLGYWAHEGTFKRAKYLRQKTYLHELYLDDDKKETKISVKCAGMPDNLKEKVNWENFNVGMTMHGKLIPKQVNGGVVLVETDFTLKG